MEITLGFGSYCKVSTYQEGLESSMNYMEIGDLIHSSYYSDYIRISDEVDY